MNESMDVVVYYEPMVAALLKHENSATHNSLVSHIASFCHKKIMTDRDVNIGVPLFFYMNPDHRWFVGGIALRKEADALYYAILIGHHTHCFIYGSRKDFLQAEKLAEEACLSSNLRNNYSRYLDELLYGVVDYEKIKTEIRIDIPRMCDTVPQQGETKK